MIGSCIYHNKNVALLDKHIISRVKVTLAAGYDRHLTDTATSVGGCSHTEDTSARSRDCQLAATITG